VTTVLQRTPRGRLVNTVLSSVEIPGSRRHRHDQSNETEMTVLANIGDSKGYALVDASIHRLVYRTNKNKLFQGRSFVIYVYVFFALLPMGGPWQGLVVSIWLAVPTMSGYE
jgi:hypothetical protein